MKEIKGQVTNVMFSLLNDGPELIVYLAYSNDDNGYQIHPYGEGANLTCNGKEIKVHDLIAELAKTKEMVLVTLHDDENSYVRIRKAEFTTKQ